MNINEEHENKDDEEDINSHLYYVPSAFLKEDITKYDEENNEISFKYRKDINESKKILVDNINLIMDISKDLLAISVDKEEPDKLKGISASELFQAKERVQLKVDKNFNQLKSVIDEYYNDIKILINSEKIDQIKYSDEIINTIEEKIREKHEIIDKIRSYPGIIHK